MLQSALTIMKHPRRESPDPSTRELTTTWDSPPLGLPCRRICVRVHRRPERNAASMTLRTDGRKKVRIGMIGDAKEREGHEWARG